MLQILLNGQLRFTETTKATKMARTWEQIQADIAEVRSSPEFQKREAKYKAAMEAKAQAAQKPTGSQAGHHVTDSNNNVRPIMGKGRGTLGGGTNIQFGEQIK